MTTQSEALETTAPAREESLGFNRRGLFLGGCPKSGTTLLLSLLDSHPQLVVLPEETFYLHDGSRYAALDSDEVKLHRLLEKTNLRLLAQSKQGSGGVTIRCW